MDEHHRGIPAEPLRPYVAWYTGYRQRGVPPWPEGGGVMLGSVRDGDTDAHGQATPTRPGTFGAYVVSDDVDAVYRRAKAAGAEIIAEPYDTDYGSHDFAAADPEGNRWSFGTYRGEPRKG